MDPTSAAAGSPAGPAAAESPAGGTPATIDPGAVRIRGVAISHGATVPIASRADLALVLADPAARLWVDVEAEVHVEVDHVADLLAVHPLIVEDIKERNQRAKIEEVDGALHVVLFSVAYDQRVAELEIDFVLDARSLLTVHGPGWDPFSLDQLRGDPGHLLGRGPDFLLYALADGIVDAYFPVLDAIEDEIDEIQDAVVASATLGTVQRIFALKRELIGLRRAISPAREIFNQLTNRDLGLVAPGHLVYFRDVYDHLIRVTDELDNDRELLAGTLDVYLSTVNNTLSAIMKRLTGVTVILAGIGAVAGIFGMSEAASAVASGGAAGFWVVVAGIVVGAVLTAAVLRRIDWI